VDCSTALDGVEEGVPPTCAIVLLDRYTGMRNKSEKRLEAKGKIRLMEWEGGVAKHEKCKGTRPGLLKKTKQEEKMNAERGVDWANQGSW